MITQENFKQLLTALGFEAQQQKFSKSFDEAVLAVDFAQKHLIYPQALIVNEKQTCNFAANENFVVFECVHRLLAKGYKPEHIELEPKWKLGHGAKSGRADILVKNQQHEPLLIIECKTAGKEFDKAWQDTQTDGAQLFSYIEQEKATQFICLYATAFDEKNQQINTFQRVISVKDNPKILEDNPQLASFAKANNNKERVKVWQNTYQAEFTQTGIFEDNVLAYHIGKDKYTLAQDTKAIEALDIKGTYHKFRTILRQHNVSRRENAFEVLVNLFLCKIVDELENPHDLHFYWKGIAYDNYFDLVDRLQKLYQSGMEQFLKQEIVYVSNQDIDNAFWAVDKRNATKAHIKELFRKLKFYKGLDFEFIKVFNKAYFDKNAKILIEIIQMWQGLRLTGSEQNQFLGDMFEYFLDNGIKQTEGQFFTPMPICKFIVSALPLEQLIQSHSEPLKVMDYACGSGHFLTEYAVQLPPLLKNIKQIDNASSYFQHIYGIEKEDRLAKVAKVSAVMYGFKEIQMIDADALEPHLDIKEASFNILIANPPFAVENFLTTIENEEHRNRYTLIKNVNDLGNKNIQCFFLERAQQLLAGNGVMGVIVPSSVLSNSDTMHIATREILFKYFDFISIVELGNNTFGKTGTNTVILFLRRKAQRPESQVQYQNRVKDFFEDWAQHAASGGGEYADVHVVREYCAHIGIDYADYQTLLLGTPNAALLATEMFADYGQDFDNLNDIKKLKDNKAFKAKAKNEQQAELTSRFRQYLVNIEQNKLYYFMLAQSNPCPVVLVKSPADNKEQKQFLGYEWSGAKGSEGVKYNGGDTVYDINTPLFDPKNRDNNSKISYVVRQNFMGETVDIPPLLQAHVSTAKLSDLLDFSRKDFNKAFSLTVKKVNAVESKWDMVKISDFAKTSSGGTPLSTVKEYYENGNIPWINSGEVGQGEIWHADNFITEEGLKNSSAKIFAKETVLLAMYGATAGKVGILKIEASTNQAVCGIVPNERILPKFLYLQLSSMYEYLLSLRTGVARDNLSQSKIQNIKIPLPPLNIQQEIVAKCEAVDEAVREAHDICNKNKELIKKEVALMIRTYKDTFKKLGDVVYVRIGGTPSRKESKYFTGENLWVSISEMKGKVIFDTKEKITDEGVQKSNVKLILKGTTLLSFKLSIGKTAIAGVDLYTNEAIAGLVPKEDNSVINAYLFHLFSANLIDLSTSNNAIGQSLNSTYLKEDVKIPVPPLAQQAALVAKIEAIEANIAAAQAIINAASTQKQAILQQYL